MFCMQMASAIRTKAIRSLNFGEVLADDFDALLTLVAINFNVVNIGKSSHCCENIENGWNWIKTANQWMVGDTESMVCPWYSHIFTLKLLAFITIYRIYVNLYTLYFAGESPTNSDWFSKRCARQELCGHDWYCRASQLGTGSPVPPGHVP